MRRLRHLVVLGRIRPGNVLLHVSSGQVQARHGEIGIQFHGRLEVLDGFRILGVLESLHALVELVARLAASCSPCPAAASAATASEQK